MCVCVLSLQREFPVDYKTRLSHLGDLFACIKGFEQESDEADAGTAGMTDRLGLLLQQLTLQSDVDSKVAAAAAKPAPGASATKTSDAAVKAAVVTLSTVHAAKGMEWDVVFVVGAEASLFPHSRSVVADGEESASSKENPIYEVF